MRVRLACAHRLITANILLASGLLAACCNCAEAAAIYLDPLFGYSKTSNVQYGAGISKGVAIPLVADVYAPTVILSGDGSVLRAIPANRPAVVLQDGGAWTSALRTRSRVTEPAIYLAERGYTVIVTDYRQGAPGLPFGLADPGPQAPVTVGQTKFGAAPYAGITTAGHLYDVYPGVNPIRAGIEDFAVAIDWARTNAGSLGIDPGRIAIAGGSAGGIDALLLQYNDNPVDPRYAARAVVALVSTMMNNYGRIQPGGPPVFLLNNTADAVVPWSPAMSARFGEVGIYREQWFQGANAAYHGVEWGLDLGGATVMERVRDFLYTQVAVPEPGTAVLLVVAMVTVGARRRGREAG